MEMFDITVAVLLGSVHFLLGIVKGTVVVIKKVIEKISGR